jgi:hypothetical protein
LPTPVGTKFCILVYPKFWADYYMFSYAHCWELLMKSVGSHSSQSLLSMMKVML